LILFSSYRIPSFLFFREFLLRFQDNAQKFAFAQRPVGSGDRAGVDSVWGVEKNSKHGKRLREATVFESLSK